LHSELATWYAPQFSPVEVGGGEPGAYANNGWAKNQRVGDVATLASKRSSVSEVVDCLPMGRCGSVSTDRLREPALRNRAS
jgi:hypothetical protein